MKNLTLNETERLINLEFADILELYLTGQIPEPLLLPDGTYQWPIDCIANFIERHSDHYLDGNNRRFWANYIEARGHRDESVATEYQEPLYRNV